MEQADIAKVHQIESLCFSDPWSEDAFRSELELGNLYVVAEKGEEILGMCGLLISFEEACVMNVAVHPEARNQGIGRKLLEYLLEKGRERAVERVFLEVRYSNESAYRLYEALGFERIGIRPNVYQNPKEDAYVYRKFIRNEKVND